MICTLDGITATCLINKGISEDKVNTAIDNLRMHNIQIYFSEDAIGNNFFTAVRPSINNTILGGKIAAYNIKVMPFDVFILAVNYHLGLPLPDLTAPPRNVFGMG